MKKLWKVLTFIGIPIGILFIYYQINKYNSNCKKYYEKFKDEIHYGFIEEKFLDKENHNNLTISYKTKANSSLKKIILNNDKSGFMNFVEIGDSISKEKGNYYFKVYRNEEMHSFLIDFGCNESD